MNAKQRARLLKTLFAELTRVVSVHPNVRNHGKQHWHRVAEVAGELAALAGEPRGIVRAAMVAGLLHDIGRISDSSRRDPDHGDHGVEIARAKQLLELLGAEPAHRNDVYEAIADHTRGVRTQQRVAMYLWDADRLCLAGFNRKIVDPERMSTRVWPKLCRR